MALNRRAYDKQFAKYLADLMLLNHARCDLINNHSSSSYTRPVGLTPICRQACNNTQAQGGGVSWWWILYWLIVLC